MIVVTGIMTGAPGSEDELADAARAVVASTNANEPDCIAYDCARDVCDPSRFFFVEKWTDGAALRSHTETEHYRAFSEVAKRTVRSQVIDIHTVEKTRTL